MNSVLRSQSSSVDIEPGVRNLPQIIALIGSSRGLCLSCGILALIVTSADCEAEREQATRDFLAVRAKYIAAIDEKCRIGPFLKNVNEIAPHRAYVHRLYDVLKEMLDDRVEMTRAEAVEFA